MTKQTIVTLVILGTVLLLCAFVMYVVLERSEQKVLDTSDAGVALAQGSSTAQFTDFQGNQTDLGQYLGQTLIVNSWASWSPASIAELQLLTDVAQTYQNQDVVVIGINRAEPRATAEAFLNKLGLTDDVLLIIDPDDSYYRAIDGYTMPETVVYDTKGNVIKHKRGAITALELTQVLDEALAQAE